MVFGAVDGLVTNASLIAGLGGGGVAAHTVVLTGVASLVAGAFSMGTGEYISVTNQNELVGAEVAVERRMHARFPAAEEAELAGVFRGYGADPDTAAAMAAAVSADPATALRVHAREELGVDPSELPSPLLASAYPACPCPVSSRFPRVLRRPGRAGPRPAHVRIPSHRAGRRGNR
jgi:vacuolar iron transporter family protein